MELSLRDTFVSLYSNHKLLLMAWQDTFQNNPTISWKVVLKKGKARPVAHEICARCKKGCGYVTTHMMLDGANYNPQDSLGRENGDSFTA